ncbi:hypothetical protein GO730_02660 [Spirosoma sp. HMF3257]|uniref:Uncharacterized protein n=1 Tax=Spirosoma telluris TaxID=2183553 RepID=A0A327NLW5_9BACT|nr:hypothetical protein [Spirosoma telluris]RAI73588.1 hypothetical protein HMF3257_02595 [Spirosoma telluris]
MIGAAPGFEFIIQHKTNKNAQTIYTITSQPTGPLQVDQLSAPLSYSLQDGSDGFPYGIKIPMLNLYGNAVPKEAHLIHDATGEITIVKRGEPASGVSGVNYNEPNFIGVELYEVKMRLGSYHIELIQDDGSVLKVGQPLLVNKGHVYIEYEGYTYFGYQVVVGGSFIITGSSLFDGDITLLLKDTTDRTFPLSNLAFNPYGQQVRVTIPSNLKPGQYVLQVLVDGALLTCLRLNIASDETTRPILGTLITSRVSEAVPCSIREPVPAAKETALFFTSNQSKQQLDKAGQHVVLKLIPNQGGDAYYARVVPFDGANTGFPGSFTIPGNVPTGLYTAILQVLDAQNKAVAESVPYGRPLNVP